MNLYFFRQIPRSETLNKLEVDIQQPTNQALAGLF
jgi:hypothetical protein